MSTFVSALIDDAALEIGDPGKTRINPAQWLQIYNMTNRELCQKVNILRFLDDFKLVTNQTKYDYPQGMIVMNGIHVSETPDDESTFKWLDELREDEFRAMTSASYPKMSIPTHYFATSSWFYLVGAVTADIDKGACIDYFGLPDIITDASTAVMQVDDIARDYLTRRMVIHADMARNRIVEARADLEIWTADLETFQDKLDDRSQDRRSSIAPRRNRFAGMN